MELQGSLINRMMEDFRYSEPQVGMGATEYCWSDRHAYTITAISKSGKTIEIRRDRAIRTDKHGMSDSQSYRYEADPEGVTYKARRMKDGRWKIIGGNYLGIGVRDEHYDFSF